MRFAHWALSVVLTLSILLSPTWRVQAAVPGERDLAYFLWLDRFQSYVEHWADNIAKKGERGQEFAKIAATWTPQYLAAQIPPENRPRAERFDGLIFKLLVESPQGKVLDIKRREVSWGYHFLKHKLDEAYVLKPAGPDHELRIRGMAPAPHFQIKTGRTTHKDKIAMNVDSYVSDRTTRAVFWEASYSGKPLELHVGDARDFLDDIGARGAKVVGEIKAPARNYNRIFLVRDKDESLRYAITEISGRDRLDHLARQAELIRWKEPGEAVEKSPPRVEVYGDVDAVLAKSERRLEAQLSVLPKSDVVIIGQKGAIERAARTAAKAEEIVGLYHADRGVLSRVLTAEQLQFVEKYANSGSTSYIDTFGAASTWDKIYEPLAVVRKVGAGTADGAAGFEAFTLDQGAYEMSDFLFRDKAGEQRRVRSFSNVWGDEIVPIVRPLFKSGHKDLVYMGTAGALPGSGFEVGDLVLPSHALDPNGEPIAISPKKWGPVGSFVRRDARVAHVTTPYVETFDYIQQASKAAQVVEVESGYIGQVYNRDTRPFQPYLMISDRVGEEGQTLAEASSSIRHKALEAAISDVFGSRDLVGVGAVSKDDPGLAERVESLAGKRDPVSVYQLTRLAREQGELSEVQLEALVRRTKPFTAASLEKNLTEAGAYLVLLAGKLEAARLTPEMGLDRRLVEGTFNPAKDTLLLELVTGAAEQARVEATLEELLKADPKVAKRLQVRVTRGPPAWVKASAQRKPETVRWEPRAGWNHRILMDLYGDAALMNEGFAPSMTRTGHLKFTRITAGDPAVAGSRMNLRDCGVLYQFKK